MATKAAKTVAALKPCIEIRDAQSGARRQEAADASRTLERMKEQLTRREAELGAAIQALSAITRGPAFGVQQLVSWNVAITNAAQSRVEAEQQSQRSDEVLAGAKSQLVAAESAARQVKRNFGAARKKVARAVDERQLHAAEEMHRQKKRPAK